MPLTKVKPSNLDANSSYVLANITLTGSSTANSYTANGNVTASYFIGNGSQLTGIVSSSATANAAFDKANSANVIAQAAFDKANSANVIAQSAFDKANNISGYSNNGVTLSGTVTPIANTTVFFDIIGITGNTTIAAPSGSSLYNGQKLIIRIKDAGTSVNISWNSIYRTIGTINLPTTTVASKLAYVGCVYNLNDTYWDVIAVSLQT